MQQGDIKPDMAMIGGVLWCVAGLVGLVAVALG